MNQIVQNEAKCLKCGDIIFSRHTHDFVTCSCGNVSVDGGLSYLKRCWTTQEFEERSLSTDLEQIKNCINLIENCKSDGAKLENFVDIVYDLYGTNHNNPEVYEKLEDAASWAVSNNRNAAGIVFAVIRAMRNNGVLNMEKFNGNQ